MVSGPLTDGCYGRGQSRTAANRPTNPGNDREPSKKPMQIVCPNCTTSYKIADTAVGKTGRSVRCVRCQTVWQVPPPVTATPGATPGADETVAAFSAELGARPAAPASAPAPPPPAPPPSEGLPEEPSLGELIRTTAFEETADAAGAPPAARNGARRYSDSGRDAPPLVPAPPVTDVTSLDDSGPPDIESVAARRARAAARKRRSPPSGPAPGCNRCAGNPFRGAARLAP